MSLDDLLARLRVFYGPLPNAPRDPFAAYVWDVLGFRTVPARREAALTALRRIPALTPDAVWKAPLPRIEAAAALAGPWGEERVRALRAGADAFRRHPEISKQLRGSLLHARRALRLVPPLGPARRARLLLFAGDHPILPVDAAVARVALRLGLARPAAGEKRQVREVRKALSRLLPHDLHARQHAVLYLDHHGQSTCVEFDPHCGVCPVGEACPEGRRRARPAD